MSTNHLMGPGYWVWLIPLGSGSTSLGIVADGDMHPFHRINRFERAMDWLREYEPQFAAMMDDHTGELEDFLALQHYAHACARVFSPDRWSLVGEAGVFTDPFYSPGSDFIAMGNDYTKDLIVRSLAGEDIASRTEAFNTTYLRLFDAFIRLYDGQYPIMGNAQVMTAKVAWDNACYWAMTALLFFQRRLVQPEFMTSIDPLMRRFFVLHARMQRFLRAWDRIDEADYAGLAANVVQVPWLRRLQASLADPAMDDDSLRQRLAHNFSMLEGFASAWETIALERYPTLERVFSDGARPAPADIADLLLVPTLVVDVGVRRASTVESTEHHRGIVAAEAERGGDRDAQSLLARFVRHDIDRAGLVGLGVMNRRRDGASRHTQCERRGLDRTGRAEAVPDHRLERRHGNAAEVVTEHPPEAARFGQIVLRRRRAVRIDVIDLAGIDARVVQRERDDGRHRPPFRFGRGRMKRFARQAVAGEFGVDRRAAPASRGRGVRGPGCPRLRRCSCRLASGRTAGTAPDP